MDDSSLQTPEPWLRLWAIRNREPESPEAVVEVHRIPLAFSGPADDPVIGDPGLTVVYKLEESPHEFVPCRFLIQMRSEGGNIVDTSATPLQLDADFAGTVVDLDLLTTVWNTDDDQFTQELWSGLAGSGASLPQSGDGAAGGRFHSFFEVVIPQ
jgi:hypothetical protein